MSYPDHHEGVTGRQLDDDLLSLDERAIPHRVALMALAHHLSSATGVGNPAPVVADMSKRIREPQIGDLVMETSRGSSPRTDPDTRLKAFGYLVARRREFYSSNADWARYVEEEPEYADADDRGTDEAWYVQYGPNPKDICRWSNAGFIVVPIDRLAFARPVGQLDERGGVTITRDDLLGDLAYHGFELRLGGES